MGMKVWVKEIFLYEKGCVNNFWYISGNRMLKTFHIRKVSMRRKWMIRKLKEYEDIDKMGVNLEINDLFVYLDSLKLFWYGGFVRAQNGNISGDDRIYVSKNRKRFTSLVLCTLPFNADDCFESIKIVVNKNSRKTSKIIGITISIAWDNYCFG